MELVRVPSLDELVRRDGPPPPHRVAAIGLAILDVLTAAQALGIVHRGGPTRTSGPVVRPRGRDCGHD